MVTPTPQRAAAPLVASLLALEHSLLFGALAARGLAATHNASASELQLLDAGVIAHRAIRDQLTDLLDHWRVAPPPASAAYVLPQASHDAGGALAIAISLEDRASATWLEAVGKTNDPGMRALCTSSLEQAAVRATRLRLAAGSPAAQAAAVFPGR